jgi:hypothetical protein
MSSDVVGPNVVVKFVISPVTINNLLINRHCYRLIPLHDGYLELYKDLAPDARSVSALAQIR